MGKAVIVIALPEEQLNPIYSNVARNFASEEVTVAVATAYPAEAILEVLEPGWTGKAENLEEVSRNCRAYAWEIGRGHPLTEKIDHISPDNPFMDKDWRKNLVTVVPLVDRTGFQPVIIGEAHVKKDAEGNFLITGSISDEHASRLFDNERYSSFSISPQDQTTNKG